MPERHYNWKRFWCPPDEQIDLSDGGYPSPPRSQSEWSLQNPAVVPYEAIAGVPCLGLLGEPGSGKSTEMKLLHARAEAQAATAGDCALLFDLRSYQTDARLHDAIFEYPEVVEWERGTHHLHLFLDSLDEGLLSITKLAAVLSDELRQLRPHVHRLSLRIACRSAEWPSLLEQELRALWGESRVQTQALIPLLREDVAEAARREGVNPDAFQSEVDQREAVPLAFRPITLRFLLSTYGRDGGFPPTRTELYEAGCRILCEEHSRSRRTSGDIGELDADQRLVVAGRIAALSVFCNRAAISVGADDGTASGADLLVSDIRGGIERVGDRTVEVTDRAVRETLTIAALFTSIGTDRIGWAHQSYAEFLAAWYVSKHGMPLDQIKSLIVHPSAPDGRLVPQLHETAAWLANLVPQIRDYVAEADPQVLLQSDLAAADDATRAAITQALLNRFEEKRLGDWEPGFSRRYDKLAHPGLADQLRPYIGDQCKGWLVRRVAIDIAEACRLCELQAPLLDVALNVQDDHPTRVQAAYALTRIAEDDVKAKLWPLAEEGDDDPNDELKGCALTALWPRHLTAHELFDRITPPRQPSLFGAYLVFLDYRVVPDLRVEDLPLALDWVASEAGRGMSPSLRRLTEGIALSAWDHLDAPGVLGALAKAAVPLFSAGHYSSSARASEQTFRQKLQEDDARRVRLVRAMLPLLGDGPQDLFRLFDEPAIVTPRDLPWLAGLLHETNSERLQATVAALIRWLFVPTDPDQADLVFRTAQENPVLRQHVRGWFEPIWLDSDQFRIISDEQREQAEREEWYREHIPRAMDPAVLIPRFLSEFEGGDVNGWWRLNWAIAMNPENDQLNELEPDLTALPGWARVAELGEARVLHAAQAYLTQADPETESWLGTDTVFRVAWAGYRAMRLLLQRDRDLLQALPARAWRRWTASVLAYPVVGTEDGDAHRTLLAMAYAAAPREFIDALSVLIDKDARQHGHVFIIREVAGCWDARLGEAVLERARDASIGPTPAGELLGELIKHGVHAARVYAESLLGLPLPTEDKLRARAIGAARVLMLYAPDCGWSAVWPALRADPEFGRAVVNGIADDLDSPRPYERLSDEELADLYIWVSRLYPHAEDPDIRGVHAVGTREHVGHWRDSLLADLKARKSDSAVKEVGRIVRELPEAEFLMWHLREAEEIAFRSTWAAPAPREVIALARASEMRLIQNADQLLDLVMESLSRLEAQLHDELSTVEGLWNQKPRVPKDESHLSNHVASHLRDDISRRGIVVNREARIRRGQLTDIHVDAISPREDDAYRVFSVIVETKGCWSPELHAAMKEQLVGRYLRENRCRYGVYLVGWFLCAVWDDDDYRKSDVKPVDLGAMREQLGRQAEELSSGGYVIRAMVLDAALR